MRDDGLPSPSRHTAGGGDRVSQHGRNTTPTRRTAVPDSRDEHGASHRAVTPTRATAMTVEHPSPQVRPSGSAGEAIDSPGRDGADPRASGAPKGRSTMRHTMNTQAAYDEFQRRQREKAEQEEVEASHRREVA
eukprot:2629875-Amphidinium_carterae.1